LKDIGDGLLFIVLSLTNVDGHGPEILGTKMKSKGRGRDDDGSMMNIVVSLPNIIASTPDIHDTSLEIDGAPLEIDGSPPEILVPPQDQRAALSCGFDAPTHENEGNPWGKQRSPDVLWPRSRCTRQCRRSSRTPC
jgi:hypothetical protein